MKTRAIFGKILPSTLNALISLCFLSIVLSNSAKADIVSGEFQWWDIGMSTTMRDDAAISSGNFPFPPLKDRFIPVSLPSPAAVSYTDYGVHVSTQSFSVNFDIGNNKYNSQPVTFSSVSGDFSWTNELWIDGNLVYTNDVEYLGVDLSLTGTFLAADSTLIGFVSLSHTDDYYVDLMEYLNLGKTSVIAEWKMVNVTGSLYDTDTHNLLDKMYGVFSPYLTLAWEGQLNIVYEYETGTNATPEPASMLIFGIGSLVGGGFLVRRKRQSKC